jgi:DNA-binding response OmpR family regulator
MGEVLWVDVERGAAGYGDRQLPLTRQEVAVLAALADARGRVVSRSELARGAGLRHASARRTDGVLVRVRSALGVDAIRTVRGRGWALDADAIVVSE